MVKQHSLPILLAFVFSGLVVTLWACTPAQPVAPRTALQLNGAALEPPVALPPLRFARTDGGTFSTLDTQGRLSLFFFGYTHCADVCPLTLAQFVRVRQALGDASGRVDLYFVTLDPARDTPERMRQYVSNFPGVIGMNGTDTELASAQSAFGVVAERRDLGDGDYALDHTAATYLVNRQGQLQLAYPGGTDTNEIIADLRQLLGALA